MSLDVYLTAMRKTEVYSANITHNLGKMALEAGIYHHLWRPEELGIKQAGELIMPLRAGLSTDTGDFAFGSDEWKICFFEEARRKWGLWWCVAGHWSAKWNNWSDGVEPSGLADPSHWMPLPPPPRD